MSIVRSRQSLEDKRYDPIEVRPLNSRHHLARHVQATDSYRGQVFADYPRALSIQRRSDWVGSWIVRSRLRSEGKDRNISMLTTVGERTVTAKRMQNCPSPLKWHSCVVLFRRRHRHAGLGLSPMTCPVQAELPAAVSAPCKPSVESSSSATKRIQTTP